MHRSPTDEELRILKALALMCAQYLSNGSDTMDHMAMSAGEAALKILAEYGYVDEGGVGRGGRWTKAGLDLLASA